MLSFDKAWLAFDPETGQFYFLFLVGANPAEYWYSTEKFDTPKDAEKFYETKDATFHCIRINLG